MRSPADAWTVPTLSSLGDGVSEIKKTGGWKDAFCVSLTVGNGQGRLVPDQDAKVIGQRPERRRR